MKKWRDNKDLLYYGTLLIIGIATVLYLSYKTNLSSGPMEDTTLGNAFEIFVDVLNGHLVSSFGLLLLQVIVILIFARLVAWTFTKMGQPSVVGEILAGIMLGPSVLGWLWPEAFLFLFPESSLHNINLLSQFGLILFMFVIGMELDLEEIKDKLRQSIVIAHSGIIVPFVLGALLSVVLFEEYGGSESTVLTFALFVGISLSVTAFPVLARIIQEQGKMKSHLGVLSMASAANGDITAWCLLAVIIAIAQAGSPLSALYTVFFAAIYMLIMFVVVRPTFALIGATYKTREVAGKGVVALSFVVLLISAYITEILGLHALFGAFIAGVVMPNNLSFRHMLTEKVEDVSLSIFLPLFFVSSGLSTQIGLLNTSTHWWLTLIITLVAIVGKVWGTYMACRVVGEGRRDSLYMGVLMNTRGLMELVILSMGLELGIISLEIYTMLVIMTLVTTFMTTPTLNLIGKIWPIRQLISAGVERLRVLFSFGRRETGVVMMNVVESFYSDIPSQVDMIGMHLTFGADTSKSDAEMYRAENFAPIQEHAHCRGYQVSEYYEVTDNPLRSIVAATERKAADLLIVGAGLNLSSHPEDQAISEQHRHYRSRFGTSLASLSSFFNLQVLFRDRTEDFVRIEHCHVGVLLDRGLVAPAKRIGVVASSYSQDYHQLIELLLTHSSAEVLQYETLDEIALSPSPESPCDLLLIPYDLWKVELSAQPDIPHHIPTTLLLQPSKDVKM